MSRPRKCRKIRFCPKELSFKPVGKPMHELETIEFTRDELEAVRLADLMGMYQDRAAESMGVSRQTFGNIVSSAHRKLADFLINVKALQIQGGEVEVQNEGIEFSCPKCHRALYEEMDQTCPRCRKISVKD